MGVPRTLAAVAVGANPPTPVYTGTPLAVTSFVLAGGVATITLTNPLPLDGFNGPNGYPTRNATTGSSFDIHGGVNQANAGSGGPAGGQQVTLWGFSGSGGNVFNGKVVSVIKNDPVAQSFSFYFSGSPITLTSETTGKAAASPFQHYRAVRIECAQTLGTDNIYVGDASVTSTQYVACLSLAGQLSVVIASENIPADRIWITGSGSSDSCLVSLIY